MPRKKIDRSIGMVASVVVEMDKVQTTSGESSTKSQINQLGVRLSRDTFGNEHLIVVFSISQECGSIFDFSSFLYRREIAVGFAEAFYGWGSEQGRHIRTRTKEKLKYFFVFLDEQEKAEPTATSIVALNQITTSLLNAFVDWINSLKITKPGKNLGQPLSYKSRAQILEGVKKMIEWLKQHRREKIALHCEIPFNPWPSSKRHVVPTKILSKQEQRALERACLSEIDEIWADFEHGRDLIQQALPYLPSSGESVINLDELGTCLAYIERYYDGFIPLMKHLKHTDPKLYKAIKSKHGGREKINRYFCPTLRMLISFILFVMSRTFGNVFSILLMERDCVYDHPVLSNRKIVRWHKGRANREQKRSYDARIRQSNSVLVILERVREMTKRLAGKVRNDKQKNRLFLYYALSTEEVNSFDKDSSTSNALFTALANFRTKHGLAHFIPSSLRLTGSDRTDEVTDGDIKARQAILGHKEAQTTQNHYNSDAIRRRNSERIATLQGKFVNWIQSGGKVDPRVVAKDLKELTPQEAEAVANGQNATTTGFICKNPFDSPQLGESKGKLCSDWLGCFVCSHAIIILDAETLARLLQLEAHLIKARSTLHPMRFALLYEPKLEILQRDILPRFINSVVRAEAEKLMRTLNPLPDME